MKIEINRAPVLCLWAAVVAECMGYKKAEALSIAKTLTGLNAQSKGRRLGIFHEKHAEARKTAKGEEFHVEFMGRHIPCINTDDGIRSVNKDKPVTPESVEKYLASKFGDHFDAAWNEMRALAKSRTPSALATEAFRLYEKFRPAIADGEKGWGAKGVLDLDKLRSLQK